MKLVDRAAQSPTSLSTTVGAIGLLVLLAGGLASAQHAPRCADPPGPLVTDTAVYQTPDIPEPAARSPYRDSVFGTCQMRVTDRLTDLPELGEGLKNEYSRVQAFNADESLVMVRGTAGNWYLYDVATLAFVRQVPIVIDPRWDANDPDLVYYADGTALMRYDLASDQASVVHDFAPDLPQHDLTMVWTRGEGSPSFDGRTWGLMAQDQEWNTVALVTYDQQVDEVLATRDLPPGTSVDSVTISPLGTYLLAFFDTYCDHGALGDDANPCGLMVYDRDLTNGRGLLRIVGHSDTALDAGGREVLVYQDIDTDTISMLDLGSGVVTELWPVDFSHTAVGLHFSGRASRLPGWALVSTYNGGYPVDFTWMDDQVFAVELEAGGRVARFAHSHSLVDEGQEHDYWAEPQASVSRDFTRIVFASNWGRTGTDQVEMHMVELPVGWSGAAPGCTLGCTASVPSTATLGAPVSFAATVEASGCSGQPAFDWDFGDGGAHSGAQTTSHTYAAVGSYPWTMTATVDAVTCQRSGTLVVDQQPPHASSWLIPAVVHAPGLEGTRWRTTVTVVNDSAQPATVLLSFYPSGGGDPLDLERALPAAGTAQWPDILVSAFGYDPEASVQGIVGLGGDVPLVATSRTYTEAAGGTFGQYLPAVAATEGLGAGEVGVLANLTRGDAYRTNVGVLNLGGDTVTVRLTARSEDGEQIGDVVTHSVPASRYWQANDFLGPSWADAGDRTIAYATVEVEGQEGRIWAYASVVDNGTGDPTTIPVLRSAR
jgi:PKD repeat protein